MRSLAFPVLFLALAGCVTSHGDGQVSAGPLAAAESLESDELADLLFSGGRVRGEVLAARIAEAQNHPLGSKENPVRVNMPPGQREYLSRLRCSDGKAPEFYRVGNFGPGVYDSIIDGYDVKCLTGKPARSMIYMDMYHPEHDEKAAPAGFTLVPRGGGPAGEVATFIRDRSKG